MGVDDDSHADGPNLMNIALDIDGTISAMPTFFAILSRSVRASGGKVYVVTSRADTPEVARLTRLELESYSMAFDDLVIIPEAGKEKISCPHLDLDWYQRYLWQKVRICLALGVDAVFEDDAKVVALFKTYAPGVRVFHVG